MKRITGLATVVAVAAMAVMAFGAFAASSASATPEFKGLTGVTDIHFTGRSLVTTLRGLNAGVLGTISCEKDLASGLILVPSMLVDNILLQFHGKCTQKVGSTETGCGTLILTKPLHGIVGWINKGATPVGLLLHPESGTVFATVVCGTNTTTVEGEIVAEIPELNEARENQYNNSRTEYELVLKASGETQGVTTFELLGGTFMTGVSLKVAGFLGGAASEEGTELVTLEKDGELET